MHFSTFARARPFSAQVPKYSLAKISETEHSSNENTLVHDATYNYLLKVLTDPNVPGLDGKKTSTKNPTDFFKTAPNWYQPPETTARTEPADPTENPTQKLSRTILQLKDDKGKPLVTAKKKLNSENFHHFLYKFRQDKSVLEERIRDLGKYETLMHENKLLLTSKQSLNQSLMERQSIVSLKKHAKLDHSADQININDSSGFASNNKTTQANSVFSTIKPGKGIAIFHTEMETLERPTSSLSVSPEKPKTTFRRGTSSRQKSRFRTSTEYQVSPDRSFDFNSLLANNEDSSSKKREVTKTSERTNFSMGSDQVIISRRASTGSDTVGGMMSGIRYFTPERRERSSRQKNNVMMISLQAVTSPYETTKEVGISSELRKSNIIHFRNQSARQKPASGRNVLSQAGNSKKSTCKGRLDEWFNVLQIKGKTVSSSPVGEEPKVMYNPRILTNTSGGRKARRFETEEPTIPDGSVLTLPDYWKKGRSNQDSRKLRPWSRSQKKEGEQSELNKTIDWSLDKKSPMKNLKVVTPQRKQFTPKKKEDVILLDKGIVKQSLSQEKEKGPRRGQRLLLEIDNSIINTDLEGWSIAPTIDNVEK